MTATLTYTMILAAILFGRKAILYLEQQDLADGGQQTVDGFPKDEV
jgi:hypothetical protein